MAASNPRRVGLGSKGVKQPWSIGWSQGRAARQLPSLGLDEVVSIKWSWGYRGQQERSPDWWCRRPDAASGFKGRDSPLIDGCRESEVSREWLIGDTIYWLSNGLNALKEPRPERMQRKTRSGFSLPRFVRQYTPCRQRNGACYQS